MQYPLDLVAKVLSSYFNKFQILSIMTSLIHFSLFYLFIYFMYTPLISFVDVVVKITVAFIVSPLKYIPFGLLNSNSHVEGIIIYKIISERFLIFLSFFLSFLFIFINWTHNNTINYMTSMSIIIFLLTKYLELYSKNNNKKNNSQHSAACVPTDKF